MFVVSCLVLMVIVVARYVYMYECFEDAPPVGDAKRASGKYSTQQLQSATQSFITKLQRDTKCAQRPLRVPKAFRNGPFITFTIFVADTCRNTVLLYEVRAKLAMKKCDMPTIASYSKKMADVDDRVGTPNTQATAMYMPT